MSMSGCLPSHGRIKCAKCHKGQPFKFDRTKTDAEGWQITSNPLAWGSSNPDVVVLGFSKGPTQDSDLGKTPHDGMAYKGGRSSLAKILHHVGLLERPEASLVDDLIKDAGGQFHFGSLIRCTVERWDPDPVDSGWKGTGGGMLDRFVATSFGRTVALGCSKRFLADLPKRTRLILMLGMGTDGNYVTACRKLFSFARPGNWSDLNAVSYFDDHVVVVHTEHFESRGALLPNWLSGDGHERGRFGLQARRGVDYALGRQRPELS
jgi:hypothetical protein